MSARPVPSSLVAAVTAQPRFHIPFEHGAWWSFFSTLIGAVAVALAQGAPALAVLALALSLGAGFVAQDWAQAQLAACLGRRSQALSQWQAPQGWALACLSLVGAATVVWQQPAPLQRAWIFLLLGLGLATGIGLFIRVFQAGRGRKSLGLTALLLASPALALGSLAFGFSGKALVFWAWPLVFYPAATLSAQSYIRGFPERARWAGPVLMVVLAGLAAATEAWLAGGLLLVLGLRLNRNIGLRWQQQPEGLPAGSAIRDFGREQAFFGVALTLCWSWSFAHL